MTPGVAGSEGIINGHDSLESTAGEMDGARITGGDVAQLVLDRDGEAIGHARRDRRRISGDNERGRRCRINYHSSVAGDGACNRVAGGDGLAAGGLEDDSGET